MISLFPNFQEISYKLPPIYHLPPIDQVSISESNCVVDDSLFFKERRPYMENSWMDGLSPRSFILTRGIKPKNIEEFFKIKDLIEKSHLNLQTSNEIIQEEEKSDLSSSFFVSNKHSLQAP